MMFLRLREEKQCDDQQVRAAENTIWEVRYLRERVNPDDGTFLRGGRQQRAIVVPRHYCLWKSFIQLDSSLRNPEYRATKRGEGGERFSQSRKHLKEKGRDKRKGFSMIGWQRQKLLTGGTALLHPH